MASWSDNGTSIKRRSESRVMMLASKIRWSKSRVTWVTRLHFTQHLTSHTYALHWIFSLLPLRLCQSYFHRNYHTCIHSQICHISEIFIRIWNLFLTNNCWIHTAKLSSSYSAFDDLPYAGQTVIAGNGAIGGGTTAAFWVASPSKFLEKHTALLF